MRPFLLLNFLLAFRAEIPFPFFSLFFLFFLWMQKRCIYNTIGCLVPSVMCFFDDLIVFELASLSFVRPCM